MEKTRLWVLTELYYPEETSTGYYLTRIAEGLADTFDVSVLCGQPNYSARGHRAPKKERRNDVQIYRASGTTLNKNVIIFRLVNIFTLSFSIFLHSIFRFRKGDRILVVTTPPSLPFIAAVAALIRGGSYTLLIHDNYPEILFAVGKLRKESFFSSIFAGFNRWIYKHAAKIIVVGRDMKKLLERKTAGLDSTISVIPNWAELETVEPADRRTNKLLKEHGLMDKLVFLYAGNMGYPNDIESIIEAADWAKNDEEIHFIFLGAGVKEPFIRKNIESRNLKNITLLEPRPRSEQREFLNACDVALVSLVSEMRGVSMPSRTYNILAAGKPMLAIVEPETELAMVIEEEKAGWVVPPSNAAELIRIIGVIKEKRSEFGEMGRRARSAAVEKYSLDEALRKYRRELS